MPPGRPGNWRPPRARAGMEVAIAGRETCGSRDTGRNGSRRCHRTPLPPHPREPGPEPASGARAARRSVRRDRLAACHKRRGIHPAAVGEWRDGVSVHPARRRRRGVRRMPLTAVGRRWMEPPCLHSSGECRGFGRLRPSLEAPAAQGWVVADRRRRAPGPDRPTTRAARVHSQALTDIIRVSAGAKSQRQLSGRPVTALGGGRRAWRVPPAGRARHLAAARSHWHAALPVCMGRYYPSHGPTTGVGPTRRPRRPLPGPGLRRGLAREPLTQQTAATALTDTRVFASSESPRRVGLRCHPLGRRHGDASDTSLPPPSRPRSCHARAPFSPPLSSPPPPPPPPPLPLPRRPPYPQPYAAVALISRQRARAQVVGGARARLRPPQQPGPPPAVRCARSPAPRPGMPPRCRGTCGAAGRAQTG